MGVRVYCLALGGADLTSSAGTMTMNVLNAVAQFERDLLIERTQSGLKRAKSEGKALGRPSIRIVTDRRTLPLNLHGLKGPELFSGVYMSHDRLAAWREGAPDPIRWIVIDDHGTPDWAREGEVHTTGVPFRTPDAETQIAAAQQGIGMTKLPCFVGDADPLLARVPGTNLPTHGTLWLLTQGETRKTKRVRLFMEFVSRRLAAYAPLLAGLSASSR